MISVIFCSFFIVLLFTPFGFILSNKIQKDLNYFTSQLIYGLIIISFIALLLNFFFPLNRWLNTAILIIPIIIIIKNIKIYYNKTFLGFLTISTFLITILIVESNVYRPDAGLYHLPYIKILNYEKIIFGLTNFHARYGHISIIQYLSAISNNFIFNDNGIVFAQALIASSVIINFSNKIYLYNKEKKYNFHFYFLISTLIFITYKMNRYSEYGNDAPAHFLFFFLISEILTINKIKIKEVCNCLILILFIILNKVTLLLSGLFIFLVLNKKNIFRLFKIKRFYFLIFFTTLWLLKNIFVSGCIIYPVKSLCIEGILWTDMSKVENLSNENEAWTKDWPNYRQYVDEYNIEAITKKDYSKKFFWVKYWSKGHLKKILNIMIPYVLFLFGLILYLRFSKKSILENSKNKTNLILMIILLFSYFVWFLKVPVFRYGYSYLISFISIIFASICLKFCDYKKNINNFFSFLMIFCFTVFVTKNFIRMSKNNNDYNNYPWPKYYAMDEKNFEHGVEEISVKNKKFYKPKRYCMFSTSPCGNYGVKDNLDFYIKKNYYVLYLK